MNFNAAGLRIHQQIIIFAKVNNKKNMDATEKKTSVRQVLDDVYEEINWAYLAKNYFGRTRSWLYHKFSGNCGGAPADFSDVDRERLRAALKDIAARVDAAADRL